MIELFKSPSEKLSRWKGRSMFLSLRVPLFNLVSIAAQAADYQIASAAVETKIADRSSVIVNAGEL